MLEAPVATGVLLEGVETGLVGFTGLELGVSEGVLGVLVTVMQVVVPDSVMV